MTLQASDSRPVCPLCGKKVKSAIEHYRIDHDVDDVEEFSAQMHVVQSTEDRRTRFAKLVEELNARKSQGKITGEEYRSAITEWVKENEP
jgi:BMFP domain-containing protein YqiC